MKLKSSPFLFASLFCLTMLSQQGFSQDKNVPELYLEPIVKVNYSDATADKPQSKSWTNDQEHWVVLGDKDGPKLLKKDSLSWVSQEEVNLAWHGLPSRADVWSKGNKAHIVLVAECSLYVVELSYAAETKQYEHQWKGALPIPQSCQSIETATITQDSKGRFWVSADMNETVMVWNSTNGRDWSEPYTLADDISADDISLIVGLQNQVSVIWSNQNTEFIMERIHLDGDASDSWSDPIIVQEGDNNADDHLNATVFANGEMALVTKNSVDEINQPQFVLRLRDQQGNWTNTPFETLTGQKSPSRPIINHVESGMIIEVHAVRNRENGEYYISVNEIIRKKEDWEFTELLRLKTKIKGKNGDVTSSKASFLADQAKLIFFSDELGNVYCFDLNVLI